MTPSPHTGNTGNPPLTPLVAQRTWWVCVAIPGAVFTLVALAGTSAAVPPVGDGWGPPFSLDLTPPSGLVTGALWLAYLVGALAVLVGWGHIRAGGVIARAQAWRAALAVAVASVLGAPQGSADHLSYVAYGRIAVQGGNPYAVQPGSWLGGTDPVVSGVQPPWEETVSVYGPLATAVQAAVAWVGQGDLRLTVWGWQVVVALSYLVLARVLLHMLTRDDEAASRAAVGVVLNPVLVGTVVFGAHVDVLAMALALVAVGLVRRHHFWAGVAAGAAMSVKLPYGAVLVGVVVSVVVLNVQARRPHPVIPALLGAALVIIPGHMVAGAHVYDQARVASRFTSLASPWRAIANLASQAGDGWRAAVLSTVPVVVLLLALLIWRLVHHRPGDADDPVVSLAMRVILIVGGAWTLAAPYVLPWYDILLWVPAVLIAWRGDARAHAVDALLLLRTTTLALAYVPGRVIGMSDQVETLTLGVRTYVAPAVLAVAFVVLVVITLRGDPTHPPGARATS